MPIADTFVPADAEPPPELGPALDDLALAGPGRIVQHHHRARREPRLERRQRRVAACPCPRRSRAGRRRGAGRSRDRESTATACSAVPAAPPALGARAACRPAVRRVSGPALQLRAHHPRPVRVSLSSRRQPAVALAHQAREHDRADAGPELDDLAPVGQHDLVADDDQRRGLQRSFGPGDTRRRSEAGAGSPGPPDRRRPSRAPRATTCR